MRIITFANQKGGCGKTTSAVNFSAGLAKKGKRTLLIDLDPQAHATLYLGYKNPASSILDIFDNLLKDIEFNPQEYIIQRNPTFSIIPSEIQLGALETELSGKTYALELLKKLTERIDNLNLDYIIIDTPPNLGFLTLNALKCTDIVMIPLECSVFSLEGSENLKKLIALFGDYNEKLPFLLYFITMFDRRSNFSKYFLRKAQAELSNWLLSTLIRNNVHLREASYQGKTIFEHHPKSRGAEDLENLVEEFLNKIEKIKDVEFRCQANSAQKVYLVGDFNNWKKREEYTMVRKNGGWTKKICLPRGKYRYKFIIDDRWIHDNSNPHLEEDNFGGYNSLLSLED